MLGIVVVNYKNELKTIDFVENQLSRIDIDSIIIIVNNCSTDESDEVLSSSLDATLIYDIESEAFDKSRRSFILSSKENLGFAKGNNYGCSFLNNHFNIDYLLLSNNDIVFISNDVVTRLVHKIETLPNVSMIGPEVLGLKGERQSPEPYYSFLQRYVWRFWVNPFLSAKQSQKLMQSNYSRDALEGIHYKIMGSFLLIKNKDFISCGMMDTNTFLYGEEVILAERLRRIGKYSYYYPSVSVLHEHSATISKFVDEERKRKLQFESEAYYYLNYKDIHPIVISIGSFSLSLYNLAKRVFGKSKLRVEKH